MNSQSILNTFLNMSKSGMNPQIIVKQMIQSNPEFRQTLIQMENMANGMSPKDFAFEYAKQNGIKEEQVLQIARMFGIN